MQTHLTQRGDESSHKHTHADSRDAAYVGIRLAGLCFYVQRCSLCVFEGVHVPSYVSAQCVLQLNLDRPSAGTIVCRRPDAGDSLTSERQKEKEKTMVQQSSVLFFFFFFRI